MKISVTTVSSEQKHVISNLLELYSHDFSEISSNFSKFEVDEDGRYGYPELDAYWNKPGRVVYLIRANEKTAGFALINRDGIFNADPVFKVAEFFVLRKYRKQGVGLQAAEIIFKKHPGNWEIAVVKENRVALQFWVKVVKGLTDKFEQVDASNKNWKGPVLKFSV